MTAETAARARAGMSPRAGTPSGAESSARAGMSAGTAIEVCDLVKDYGRGRGVFDVSFAVQPGEVFGFLGSNGAGKTVTMRNLMGFIRPDAGAVRIQGSDCFADRARIQQSLGYLPGEIACMDEMTGTAFLEFMARMKGLRDRTRCAELIDYFELDAGRRIRKMSKGTKQKVGLVCAFMGRPDILLLDEPTSGLDPLMQSRFIELVLAEKRRGATIMLSSHLFEEVERTCDRVAFIRAGRLAAVEDMDDVRRTRKRVFTVTFADAAACERYRTAHPDANAAGESAAEVTVAGSMDAFVKDLAAYPVADLAAREQSLEELFMHLYGAEDDSSTSPRSTNVSEGSPGARDWLDGGGAACLGTQARASEPRSGAGGSRGVGRSSVRQNGGPTNE